MAWDAGVTPMSDEKTIAELKETIVHLLAKDLVTQSKIRVLVATTEAGMRALGAHLPPNQTLFQAMEPEVRTDVERTLIDYETRFPAMAARLSQLIEEMYPDKI